MTISKKHIILISILIIVLIGILIILLLNINNNDIDKESFFTDEFTQNYVPLDLKQYTANNGNIEISEKIRKEILDNKIFYEIVNNYNEIEEDNQYGNYYRVLNTINVLKYTNLLMKNESNDIDIPVINGNNPNYYINKSDFELVYEEVNGVKFNEVYESLNDIIEYNQENDLIYIYLSEEGDREEGHDKKFAIESLTVQGDIYTAVINGYTYDYSDNKAIENLSNEILQGNYAKIEENSSNNFYHKIVVKFKENMDGKYNKYIIIDKDTYLYCSPDNFDFYYIYLEEKDINSNMDKGKIQVNYYLDGKYINKNDEVYINTYVDMLNEYGKYVTISGRLRFVDNKLVLFQEVKDVIE